MKKLFIFALSISITALTSLPAHAAVSKIKKGVCPEPEDVTVCTELHAVTQPKGGWSVPELLEQSQVSAVRLRTCEAVLSSLTHKNRIACGYDTSDNKFIWVYKDKPDNYECTCDANTGKYNCVEE
jgi:hypothetical protein